MEWVTPVADSRHKLGLHRQLPTRVDADRQQLNSEQVNPERPKSPRSGSRSGRRVQRSPLSTRLIRTAIPAAAVVALLGTSVAMALPDSPKESAAASFDRDRAPVLEASISRSLDVRPPLEERTSKKKIEIKPVVKDHKYSTAKSLNVRTEPKSSAKVLTTLDRGAKVGVTDLDYGEWAEISFKGESRWVTGKYLSDKKPPKPKPKPESKAEPAPAGGVSGAPCASGSGVESGLQPDTIKVHRAVCALFPSISRYGGRGGSGEHAAGRALDIMTSNVGTGDQIAAYLQKNASKLGVSEVIWRQRIWTVQRSGDGWRSMPDRGSPTANHYDHVHATTYGSAAR